MKFADVFPSHYIKAFDLEDGDRVLTIEAVGNEKLNDGERRCLSFTETDKKLLLNRTNWTKCAELTGEADDSRWVGHKIRLVKRPVSFRGDMIEAVRVDAAERAF